MRGARIFSTMCVLVDRNNHGGVAPRIARHNPLGPANCSRDSLSDKLALLVVVIALGGNKENRFVVSILAILADNGADTFGVFVHMVNLSKICCHVNLRLRKF